MSNKLTNYDRSRMFLLWKDNIKGIYDDIKFLTRQGNPPHMLLNKTEKYIVLTFRHPKDVCFSTFIKTLIIHLLRHYYIYISTFIKTALYIY